jgi:hypothetical protein
VKPYSVIFIIGFATLILFACTPPQPAPPPSDGQNLLTYNAYCDASKNSDPFLKHVHFLQFPFVPTYPYSDSTPIDSTDFPTGTAISKDLEDAFNAAAPNPTFQQQLCHLSGILINPCAINNYDPSKCSGMQDVAIANNSWGFRMPTPGASTRYIALSLALWQNGPAPQFLDFETRRIQALLLTILPNAPASRLPSFSSLAPSAANTSAMSILAALAHEFGHVYWYDEFVTSPGGSANTTDPNGFCRGAFYLTADWPYPVDVPSGRWLSFGEIRNQDPRSDLANTRTIAELTQ